MKICLYKYFWYVKTLLKKFRFGHIGKKSYIGPRGIFLGTKKVFIGNEVRIYPGVRLEAYEDGKIKIEDDVSIGQNFHCTARDELVIGAHSTILGNVFITDMDHDYQEIGVHILKQKCIVKQTHIGENCFIGYGAAIQAGTKLGKQCVVGANAVVRGEFPDYSVIVGAPAKIVKKYNVESGKWERVAHE